MEFQQTTPITKLENSPTESLMSAPGDNFTSLFAVTTPSATSTMNPMDIMTPQSCVEDQMAMPIIKQEEGITSTPSPSPAPEKKTTKKRKSWGQVLPEPKTNLPPRKRAKTADEKEQRRVERVLRNRRAAQSSRERKRQEVELLEKRNKELEQMNARLVMELDQFRRTSGLPPVSPQEFLSSQSTQMPYESTVSPTATVDPAALSPCLSPVAEESEDVPQQEPLKEALLEQTESTSPDLTQHPAAMLSDLQCQMSAEVCQSFKPSPSQAPMPPTSPWLLPLQMMLLTASVTLSICNRPMTQIALCLRTGTCLHPTPQLLTTILWAVTRPRSVSTTSSTSVSSSTTTATESTQNSSRPTTPLRSSATSSSSSNLRLKSLRKILSSSPSLARPLKDATLVALRLVSEGCEVKVENEKRETEESRGQDELTRLLSEMTLPSRELLMTVLWTIESIERRRIQRETSDFLDRETRSRLRGLPTKKSVLSIVSEEESNWVEQS